MNKRNNLILILVISSTMTGCALAADKDINISPNETIAQQVITPGDTIALDENVEVINITENSNETSVVETIIKEEQEKSSPGFSLNDTVISLIIATILIMVIGRYIK